MKNKIKILYLFNHLRYGGAEVGLATTLKYIDRTEFACAVVSIEKRGAVGEEIEKTGTRVIYLDTTPSLFNLPLILKILKIVKKEKPDILHTSLFYSNFFGRIAALLLLRARPVVITEERSMYTEKRFYHVILDNILSRVTDKIIACSRSVVDFTVRQEKIPERKFHLIYNAVDSARFDIPESKDEIRRRYGLSGKDFVVGTVGSLIPKKGHRFLIEACSDLVKSIPDIKLLIIGEGESREALERLVRSVGISQRVRFLGPRKEVPEIVKMMDLFVLPSLQEGFPRTLLEAMYMGLPVCASNISGIPEIIRNGQNGLMFEPADPSGISRQIFSLCSDAGFRKNLGSNARKTVEAGYLPEDYLRNLEGLYLKLYEDKKR